MAGGDKPGDRVLDGVDLGPLLLENRPPQREPYFYYRGRQIFAVRQGPWKAHFITQPGYGPEKPEPHDPPLLYNLVEDPGERFEIGAQHPEVIAAIKEAMEKHRAGVEVVKDQLEATVEGK
jgi:arylsulfatase